MHTRVAVIIDKPNDVTLKEVESLVDIVLSPHFGVEYDWYQIGGRYTGTFDGYDPEADPNNKEVCSLCKGTGKRTDMEVVNGCNGCSSTGISIKWPTQWGFHDGDVVSVADALKSDIWITPIVTPDDWTEIEYEDDTVGRQEWVGLLSKYPDKWLVVVDCHY